jgi:hypothetical protein
LFFQLLVSLSLLLTSFGLILVSLSIAIRTPSGQASDYITPIIVVGVVCLVMFDLWENCLTKILFFMPTWFKGRLLLLAALFSPFTIVSVLVLARFTYHREGTDEVYCLLSWWQLESDLELGTLFLQSRFARSWAGEFVRNALKTSIDSSTLHIID